MKFKKITLILLIVCTGATAQQESVPLQPWYIQALSFVQERIWQPLYSRIRALFFTSRQTLARLTGVLVVQQKQVPEVTPSAKAVRLKPAVKVERSDSYPEHAIISLPDTSPLLVNEVHTQIGEKMSRVSGVSEDSKLAALTGEIEQEDVIGVTYGIVIKGDKPPGKSEGVEGNVVQFMRDQFQMTLENNLSEGYSVEQSLLNLFQEFEQIFKGHQDKDTARCAGFVIQGKLVWVFGGMGTELKTFLLKKGADEPLYITKPTPFASYFNKTYTDYNPQGDLEAPDRFLGGFSLEIDKPYFVAQPHITCLQLESEGQYYLVSTSAIQGDKLVEKLRNGTDIPLSQVVQGLVEPNGEQSNRALALVEVVESPKKEVPVSLTFEYDLALGSKKEMQDFLTIASNKEGILAAIFDGHGIGEGREVAHFATNNFLSTLTTSIQTMVTAQDEMRPSQVSAAIIQTGLDLEDQIQSYTAGTTATGVFFDRVGGLAYVFNIGDSRTALFDNQDNILFSSTDHSIRTSIPEQHRVIAMGGRIIYKRKDVPLRIGTLIPSRTLGDKGPKEHPHVKGSVIAHADVTPVSLPSQPEQWPVRVVVASDGIWDRYQTLDEVEQLAQEIKEGQSAQRIIGDIIRYNEKKKIRSDNCALIIGTLERLQ